MLRFIGPGFFKDFVKQGDILEFCSVDETSLTSCNTDAKGREGSIEVFPLTIGTFHGRHTNPLTPIVTVELGVVKFQEFTDVVSFTRIHGGLAHHECPAHIGLSV